MLSRVDVLVELTALWWKIWIKSPQFWRIFKRNWRQVTGFGHLLCVYDTNYWSFQTHDVYPLVAKKTATNKKAGKFRSNFTDFWIRWLKKIRNSTDALYDENLDETSCFEIVKMWLISMSSSSFRPFRHTSTAVSLILLTGLCETMAKVQSEWTTANRQLSAQSGKGGARKEKLEEDISDLQDKKIKLDQHLQDMFDRCVPFLI
jgi:hypothetical protein